MRIGKKFEVVESNQSWENYPNCTEFEVFDDRGNLIIEGFESYDITPSAELEDGSQESGDFSVGHCNYDILESKKIFIRNYYSRYTPYAALKSVLKYFDNGNMRIELSLTVKEKISIR